MRIIITFICIALLNYCKSPGGVTSKGKDVEFQLIAPDIRIEKYKETWNMKGEGPVKLDCNGNPCKENEISALKPDQIKALKKNGVWKEYVQKEDKDKKKFSVFGSSGSYVDGKKDGIWVIFFETGEKLREVPYKLGKKDGVEKKYTIKGEVSEETTYVEDKKNGPYWKKAANGLKSEEGNYKNDLKDGLWTSYYAKDSDNIKKKTTEYLNDKKNGKEISYYPDGSTIKQEGTYKEDGKTGYWKNFYDNGKPQSEGSYGACKTKPTEKTNKCMKDKEAEETETVGKKEEEAQAGDATAKKEEKKEAPKACRTGIWKEYYKNGTVFAEGNREHTRTGIWKFYYNDGSLRFKGDMANEIMMKTAEVYKNGIIEGKGSLFFSIISIDEATQQIKDTYRPAMPYTYFKNGKPEFEISKVSKKGDAGDECSPPNDEFIGIQYDDNGQKIGEGPIAPGGRKKNGCWMLNGKKTFFIMDSVKSGKMAEMQGCS